jgi:arylsulfatase A-like enzyme
MRWLERHYKEDFFLYVDTWDPHEPWDAPDYYTEPYWPGYDGEVVQPPYCNWQDAPGFTEKLVDKAHATYMGEITMVDAWVGHLLRRVEDMGLMDKTAIIFTSDHGFYFGEHGGRFGKMTHDKRPDGSVYVHGDEDASWAHSPLYEELVRIPLIAYVPGARPGDRRQLTSVVDVMPTVLDITGQDIPDWVEGRSLMPMIGDSSVAGRDIVASTIPFANPGDPVQSVDNIRRQLRASPVTTVSTGEWSLLYSMDDGMSELFDLRVDRGQGNNVIASQPEVARELHQALVGFLRETNVAPHLLDPRLELRI